MYPPVWGSQYWAVIHLTAYVYPDKPSLNQQHAMKNFISSLCSLLPCPACSIHATDYVTKNPIDTGSRDSVKKWCHRFHNAVNLRTGKTELTYQEAEEAIQNQFFLRKDWEEAQKGQDKRREDHKAIDKWKKIAQENIRNKDDKTTVVILGTIVFILLVALICVIFMKRKRVK